MRIHIHNPPNDPDFTVTPADWHAAAVEAGEPPHDVSFGTTHAEWDAVRSSVELVIGPPRALRTLPPLGAPHLQLVFVNAAGVDALAPFGWLPESVVLLNNRGTHGPKVGEFVLMAVLMLALRMPALATAQRAGRWRPEYTAPLAGRRVSIVGTGDLGSAGARALATIGVSATGVRTKAEPHPDFAEVVAIDALDALLPRTEFLILACPLTPATRSLLDRRRLGLLPGGAGVINIGRGALLDGDALCDALESGHISGAVLDVFDPEPLPDGHRMWYTPNLVITPHCSCDDPVGYNGRSLAILFENLRALRAGATLPNRVDPARGY